MNLALLILTVFISIYFVSIAVAFLLYRESIKDGDFTRSPWQNRERNDHTFGQHKVTEHSTMVGEEGLSILIVGRAGTGKSTLINGLIGREEEEELISEKYSSFKFESLNINGMPLALMFWNSPKQQDADSGEIKQRIEKVDLVMYVLRMDDTRIRPQDSTILRTLSRVFGRTLWSKAMFVLTFANKVEYLDGRHIPRRTKEYLNKKTLHWESFIHECLSQEGLPEVAIRDIPIVPVGHYSDLMMFEGEDWTVLFVDSILKRLRKEVRPALLKICKYCHHL